MTMQPKAGRKWKLLFFLFLLSLSIKLFSLQSQWVEDYYSNGLYVFISRLLRLLFGWLPFSIGDILYAAAVIRLLVWVVRFVRTVIKRRATAPYLISCVQNILSGLLWVYIVFNLFWGLNYNRRGIAYQLQLHPKTATREDLTELTGALLQKLNTARKELPDTVTYLSYNACYEKAVTAYSLAQQQYPFLAYRHSSIKSSLYSLAGNYLGYSGYYNPFTAEAQVNDRMLPFTAPYVACHEMAHQLGYATEDEANFVGYLTAKASADPQFRYSVYFDLFNYANGELYLFDSAASRHNYRQLDTLVKKDIRTYRLFWQHYENAIEPVVTLLYGKYLKANNQPKGMRTYNGVTEWLIDYRKRYKDL